MFIPKGHHPLSAVVELLANERDPETMGHTAPPELAAFERVMSIERAMAASASIAPGKKYHGRSTEPVRTTRERRLLDLKKKAEEWRRVDSRKRVILQEARTQLLQALGDGDVRAIIIAADGNIHDVPVHAWRAQNAAASLLVGQIAFHHAGADAAYTLSGRVLMADAEFRKWRGPPRIAATAATINKERQVEHWLTEQMQQSPETPWTKTRMKEKASSDLGITLPGKAWGRAWGAAVRASGAVKWSHGGARKRIDAPASRNP